MTSPTPDDPSVEPDIEADESTETEASADPSEGAGDGGEAPSVEEVSAQVRRREWISSWGPFLAGIAATLGLVLSSIATFVSVATLNDQRRSTQDQDKREQLQLSKSVSYWVDGSNFYIANQSDAPITSVDALVEFANIQKETKEDEPAVAVQVIFPSIPACTLAGFDLKAYAKSWKAEPGQIEKLAVPDPQEMAAPDVFFHDVNGNNWRLTWEGVAPSDIKGYPPYGIPFLDMKPDLDKITIAYFGGPEFKPFTSAPGCA
ncbi:hypothetical protein [Streptomyces sp. NBC_01477]|uniref:hypothetical protein n=1 Tax=Streptomyces sp. NBC_01477 TaxID=2976015 RepID=UPI002E329132|nr:hypothetical protein [Streptomyces sp. NBC_01477]